MTEHCVNNRTSICQTKHATHLIITIKEFRASKTIGFTYSGERSELEFHLVSNTMSHEYRLSLHVTNNSSDKWHILTYDDPLNNSTKGAVKELPAKEDIYLYSIREFWFGKSDELVIFFRLDRDAEMLLYDEIDQEQLERLYRSLESLQQDAQFADMTVNGAPAHRAVVAAASHSLHLTVAGVVSNKQGNSDDKVCQSQAKKRKVVQNIQQIDCEAMELPQPDNYTLKIRELLKKHIGSFLRYIYTGDVGIPSTTFDWDSLVLAKSLIAVALKLNIRGLVNAVEYNLNNYLNVDKTSSYLKEIIDLAASYELHALQARAIDIIRSPDFMCLNVDMDDPAFLKYLISVQPNDRHQVKHTITIPNVYKLRYRDQKLYSGVINICKIPLQVRVERCGEYSDELMVFLDLKDFTKSVHVKIEVSVLAKDRVCPVMRSGQHLFNSRNSGWSLALMSWDTLTDHSSTFVNKSGSVTILTCVELK